MLAARTLVGGALLLFLGVIATLSYYQEDLILHEIRAVRAHGSRISIPGAFTVQSMSKLTRTKTVGEETYTLTCCQVEGESYEDFLRRCEAEWKRLCEAIGG